MGIGNTISNSLELLANRQYESAMALAMNALDATASREYPELKGHRKVGERIKRFLRDHFDIITFVGTGGAIHAVPRTQLIWDIPESGKPKSLEGILYEVVRCYLTHEAELPAHTYFNEQAVCGETAQGFSIPVLMEYAVILAVVAAKTNAAERAGKGTWRMMVLGRSIPVDECWGDRAKILTLLGITSAENRASMIAAAASAVVADSLVDGKGPKVRPTE